MKIIISATTNVNDMLNNLPWRTLPQFLPETERLRAKLKSMSRKELKKLWKCTDALTAQNIERIKAMDLYNPCQPAILSYEGLQYQCMTPGYFKEPEFDYMQEHLRILSGFYGILRPFDGIMPYRLDMKNKLSVGKAKDLYEFWGDKLANSLFDETDCIINLATKEHSVCVSRYLPKNVSFITCTFAEEEYGELSEKGVINKMVRGEFVQYMTKYKITTPEHLKAFQQLGYQYSKDRSNQNTYIFMKKPQ